MAVCVQSSVFQLSHTHSALECVPAAPAGLHVCQRSACKSFGRTGVQHRNQYFPTNTVVILLIYFNFHNTETCLCCFLLYTNGQCFVEMGLIDVSPVSMVTGLCSALAVLPVGGLVSLVFRVSKVRILRLPDIVPQFLLATQLNVRSTACIHSDNLYLLCMIYLVILPICYCYLICFRPHPVVCPESSIRSRCLMSTL